MYFYSVYTCNFRTQYDMALVQTAKEKLLAEFFSCSFCVASLPASRLFWAWTCVCFVNNKNF